MATGIGFNVLDQYMTLPTRRSNSAKQHMVQFWIELSLPPPPWQDIIFCCSQRDSLYHERIDFLSPSSRASCRCPPNQSPNLRKRNISNLGQLPLDRIHNMLKTFVTGSDHKYNKTPQQLQIFLQQLCKGDKLEFGADGMYKLVKK